MADFGPFTINAAMARLFDTAAPGMSREELDWFASASDDAEAMAQRLAFTLDQVGMLVASDATARPSTGCLQDTESVSVFMFALAESLRGIAALVHVGNEAAMRLAGGGHD